MLRALQTSAKVDFLPPPLVTPAQAGVHGTAKATAYAFGDDMDAAT
jgi:hypothetical protein